MNILVLHSRYRSGALSGENTVAADEVRLLREGGHSVDFLALSTEGASAARLGVRAIFSPDSRTKVRERLRASRPDVTHIHNLFPMLSPGVLPLVARKTPALMTLHNYRLLCLPATLLRDGHPCELCVNRIPWRGVLYACFRRSRPASAALATAITAHRVIGSFGRVTLFLSVSEFVRRKHLEGGFLPERMRVKPNFAWPSSVRQGPGSYFIYAGRLSPGKGVEVLLSAWRGDFGRLLIAGDGPQARQLRDAAGSGVEFLGPVKPTDIPGLLQEARALIVPSVSYEGAPRGILEAYASGTPVVASRIGALEEIVEHGISGLHVEAGNPAAWAEAIGQLLDDNESERLGEGAYRLWQEHYTPETGLANLEAAYREAMRLWEADQTT